METQLMRMILVALPLLSLSLGCSSCGGAQDTPPSEPLHAEPAQEVSGETPNDEAAAIAARPPTADEVGAFAASSNALAFDLYREVRDEAGNLAFSPASISLAFAMTYAGARADTAAEMQRVLRFPDDADALHASASSLLDTWNDAERETYTLRIVNRLFGEETYAFEAPFLALTRDRYAAPLESVDFAGAAEAQRTHINSWVATETQDLIRDLLPQGSLDELTRLVLVNAVYFKGDWVQAFDTEATRPEPFHVGGTTAARVPMMRQTNAHRYAEIDGVQVVEMPYQGDELAMTIVLPRERNGLGALEASFDQAAVDRWVGALTPTRVEVVLPRFRLDDARIPLKDTLASLGMTRAFDRATADFSGMANPANYEDELYISDCFHEAFVEVDEEGTEAAAATAVVMGSRGGAPQPPAAFRADHPFLFMIRDLESGTILFLGRVNDPRSSV
jgi:serpin B